MKRGTRFGLGVATIFLVVAGAGLWSSGVGRSWSDGLGLSRAMREATPRRMLWDMPELLRDDALDAIEPVISNDGDFLIFAQGRAKQNAELMIAYRKGLGWSEPEALAAVNSSADELGPALSADGRSLYFYSDREGGVGAYDLWVSHKLTNRQWQAAVNLGTNVNSVFSEYDPTLRPDGQVLLFASDRPSGELPVTMSPEWEATQRRNVAPRNFDIFGALVRSNGVQVAERLGRLNSDDDDGQPAFSDRGEFLFFSSNREGGSGGFDIYRSRVIDGRIETPELLESPVNTAGDEMDPAPAMHGFRLVFSSNRGSPDPHAFDLYQTTSREVFSDLKGFDPSALMLALRTHWLWILLALLALFLLIWLIRFLASKKRRMAIPLVLTCFLVSGIIHLLILLFFGIWIVTDAVLREIREPNPDLAVSQSALAREKISLELREDVTKLASARPELPAAPRMETPALQSSPTVLPPAPAMDFATPSLGTFVAALPPPSPQPDLPPEPETLPPSDTSLPPLPSDSASELALELPEAPSEVESAPESVQNRPLARKDDAPTPEAAPQTVTATEVDLPSVSATSTQAPELPELLPDMTTPSLAMETLPAPSAEASEMQLEQDQPRQAEPEAAVQQAATGSLAEPEREVLSATAAERIETDVEFDSAVSNIPLRVADAPQLDIRPLEQARETGSLALPAADLASDLPQLEQDGPRFAEAEAAMESPSVAVSHARRDDRSELPRPPVESAPSEVTLSAPTVPGRVTPAPASPELVLAMLAPSVSTPDLPAASDPRTTTMADQPALESAEAAPAESQPVVSSGVPAMSVPRSPAALPTAPQKAVTSESTAPSLSSPQVTALSSRSAAALPVSRTVTSQSARPTLLPAEAPSSESPSLESAPSLVTEAGPASDANGRPAGRLAHARDASDPLALPPALPGISDLALPTTTVAFELEPVVRPGAFLALPTLNEGPALDMASLPDAALEPSLMLEDRPIDDLLYSLRQPEARKDMLQDLGGSAETEESIRRALKWLSDNQEADGHWSMKRHGGDQKHTVASTALATLAFLGFGETHTVACEYQDTLRKSIDWLCSRESEGDLRSGGDMYDQGTAAIALAEAYSLTKDPKLKPVVERVTRFIIDGQNKQDGGWRYSPGQSGDTSVYGWQMMALKSARLAGIEVPEPSWLLAESWLKKVGGGKQGGGYGYQDRNPMPAMVAEGMFCRQILGLPTRPETMDESAALLKKHLPSERNPDFYLWYYGSLSLYQHQGPVWQEWNNRIKTALLFNQERNGNTRGSWTPRGSHGDRMGRAVSTALGALTLEVYYRYLPLYGIGPEIDVTPVPPK